MMEPMPARPLPTTATTPVWATIDLGALVDNLAALRSRLPEGTALLAAVKANAYGHGAVGVSRHLEQTGAAELLGVATVGEGAELRRAGIELPILKLSHCLPDELDEALAARLELTVVDEASIRQLAEAVARTPRPMDAPAVPVHLKLDSGMGRIGAPLADAARLARLVLELDGLELAGVFTHLPISDVADDEGYTDAQLGRFRAAVGEVTAAVGPVRYVHAANSGAILGHGDDVVGLTLARPGIAMYGHYPDPTTPRTVPLRPVMSLATRLTFRKWVEAGTTIGYGRTWTAERDTWVGTVPLGYGDGFSRLNSNRGHLLVGGRRVPVVGRVCMDQTMVDLGPDSTDEVGAEVVAIGRQGDAEITVDELAELMGTITYEVTCLVAERVQRVHVR